MLKKTMYKDVLIKSEINTLVVTKANKRWMQIHKKKIKELERVGLDMDVIKVIARYIGSCAHDKKKVCKTCGKILSKKQSRNSDNLICYIDEEIKFMVYDVITEMMNQVCEDNKQMKRIDKIGLGPLEEYVYYDDETPSFQDWQFN